MSIDRNEPTHELPDQSLEGCPNQSSENESWLADLCDLRVIVFLVSVVVVAMTATVVILSRNNNELASIQPAIVDAGTKTPASSQANQNAKQSGKSDPSKVANSVAPALTEKVVKQSVEQSVDGSFAFPIGSSVVSGCETSKTGITNWETAGSAQWQLEVTDRRTGLFRCFVTYRAKFESRFAVQLGDGIPLNFTVYPQKTDFTEEFIVRIDKPNRQSLRLIANQVEKVSGVTVTKIRLIPR